MIEVSRYRVVLLLCAALGGMQLACSKQPGPAVEPLGVEEAGEVEGTEAAPVVDTAAAAPPVPIDTTNDERSVAQRMADASTAARIRSALAGEQGLRLFDFTPAVVHGRVTLQGEVKTAAQRERAAEVARGVEGVRAVTNAVVAAEAPGLVRAEPSRQPPAPPQPTGASPAAEAPSPDPPPSASAPEPRRQESGEVYHTVRSGESLWTVAQQHGVTVEQVRRLNGLRSNNLQPGQRLRVK